MRLGGVHLTLMGRGIWMLLDKMRPKKNLTPSTIKKLRHFFDFIIYIWFRQMFEFLEVLIPVYT